MSFSFFVFFAFIGSGLLFLMTPGPVTLLIINKRNLGLTSILKTILGTNLASLVLITIAMLMLQGLVVINPDIFEYAKIIGSFYIFYYGWKLARENILYDDAHLENSSNFFTGFLIGISNPKDVIFFISFFPQFLSITDQRTLSLIILTITWIIIDYSVLVAIGLFSQKFIRKRFFSKVGFFSGICFVLISVVSLATSANYMFGSKI